MRRLVPVLITLILLAETPITVLPMTARLDGPRASQSDADSSNGWLQDSSFGFKILIDSWTLTCCDPDLSPAVYIYMDTSDFTGEKLQKVFSGFSELYAQSNFLSVTAISDLDTLEKVMRDRGAFLGSEPDAFKPGLGQMGAFFVRRLDGEEEFQYTPYAHKPQFDQVVLRAAGSRHKRSANSELKLAALTGNTEVVRELFDEGGGVKFKSILRFTPLIYAAREGSPPSVEKLIMQGAEIDVRDRYGRTALLEAAGAGNTQVVQILLRNGADLEARDSRGNSALILAVCENQLETTRLLIAKGADVHAKTGVGSTAFDIAKLRNRNPALIKMLGEASRN